MRPHAWHWNHIRPPPPIGMHGARGANTQRPQSFPMGHEDFEPRKLADLRKESRPRPVTTGILTNKPPHGNTIRPRKQIPSGKDRIHRRRSAKPQKHGTRRNFGHGRVTRRGSIRDAAVDGPNPIRGCKQNKQNKQQQTTANKTATSSMRNQRQAKAAALGRSHTANAGIKEIKEKQTRTSV